MVACDARSRTRHRHDRVGAEFTGQPHGAAQRGVVVIGDRLVGVQRIAPHVQRVESDAVLRQLVQPRLSRRRVGEHRIGIQVRVRGVTTCADLDGGDLRNFGAQPGQYLVERDI